MAHLGFGLPYAMAMQLTDPDRPVFNITGDGGFGFTLQELDTARRYQLPVVTVIHNNESWGVIRQGQSKQFGFELGTGLEGTDYAAIARGFGCHGEHVSDVDDVAPAIERGLASGLPSVIDCRTRFVPHPAMAAFGSMNRFGSRRRERTADDVADLILGPMLRHVGPTSATIWVETDAPCTVEVLGHRARTFTVAGHHYALVIVEGLAAGLDPRVRRARRRRAALAVGRQSVPALRDPHRSATARAAGAVRLVPHGGPARAAVDARDGARPDRPRRRRPSRARPAHARSAAPTSGRTSRVMLGDQVYADDSSPVTHERIEKRREHAPVEGLPTELVNDFEEYCWLYHESWSPDVERWFFSVVPTAMIFDDHEMIDDWNISDSWVRDIRQQPWWSEHVVGGLVSYWIYQHLGNLSPAEIRAEGMLGRARRARRR